MYLHVGNNKTIKMTDIVGIFDTDTATVSKYTKNYLSACEKRGETVYVTMELPKSFILTSAKGENTVYFSQLSGKTLCQRADDITAEMTNHR
jgi:hypothetical protein